MGARFIVVDPDDGTRRDAFDHDRLAAALSVAARHAVSAEDLPITAVEIGESLQFNAFDSRWEWSDEARSCVQLVDDQPAPFGEVVSPDKSWVAFRRDDNIWVRSHGREQEFALTDDAEPDFDYGGLPDASGMRVLMRLLVCRVESAPRDGGRPVEHRTRYPMPGEEAQATMSWTILDIRDRTMVRQQDQPTTITHPTAIVSVASWVGSPGSATVSNSRQLTGLRCTRSMGASNKKSAPPGTPTDMAVAFSKARW